jgi:hypothetical protein
MFQCGPRLTVRILILRALPACLLPVLTSAFKGKVNLKPQRHGQELQFEPPRV